jgi:uncharacterized protein (DUF2336 family)
LADTIEIHEILALAQSRAPEDRERLMLALVDLCQNAASGGSVLEPAVQMLMNSIFMTLVADAEKRIRQTLSEHLATASWAPHALVNVLALDEIEIARPIIAQSPVLDDQDLIQLLTLATIEHQIEVATRPALSESVVEAVLRQGEPAVLTALAGNDTADVTPAAMAHLLEASRQFASLRSPLVRHPRLTSEMAEKLYLWVGQSLRAAIVGRFRVDAAALDRAMASAVNAAQVTGGVRSSTVIAADLERRDAEWNLIKKLRHSGQLRPGYLIKALRDQRLSLFVAALAQLIGVQREQVELTISGDRPELLALACTAAGVDRSAYSTILQLVRDLNKGLPAGGSEAGRRAMMAFDASDPDLALRALRQATQAA